MTGHSVVEVEAFPNDMERLWFLGRLSLVARETGWDVIAYCVLGNHFHLIVRTPEPNLGDGMRVLMGRHAVRINRSIGRKSGGPVWRDRYHSRVVTTEAYLVRGTIYVDLNAFMAGLVDDPADWPWSSFHANAGLVAPRPWHDPGVLHRCLGGTPATAPAAYGELVRALAARRDPGILEHTRTSSSRRAGRSSAPLAEARGLSQGQTP